MIRYNAGFVRYVVIDRTEPTTFLNSPLRSTDLNRRRHQPVGDLKFPASGIRRRFR